MSPIILPYLILQPTFNATAKCFRQHKIQKMYFVKFIGLTLLHLSETFKGSEEKLWKWLAQQRAFIVIPLWDNMWLSIQCSVSGDLVFYHNAAREFLERKIFIFLSIFHAFSLLCYWSIISRLIFECYFFFGLLTAKSKSFKRFAISEWSQWKTKTSDRINTITVELGAAHLRTANVPSQLPDRQLLI